MNKVMTMISNDGCFLESCEPVWMNYPQKKNWHASSAAVSGATVSSLLGQLLFWGEGSEGSGFSWKQHLISKSGSHPFLQMLEFFHFSWLQSCSWHPTGPPKAPHWLYDLLPLRHAAPPRPGSWQFGSLFFQTLAFHSGGLLQGVQVFTWKSLEIKSYRGEWWQIFIIINSVSLACWIFFAASLPL